MGCHDGGEQLSPLATARPVSKDEIKKNKLAQQANDAEWQRLRDIGTWIENQVEEASVVRKRFAARNKWKSPDQIEKAHFGRVFCITVEKNAELPVGHPLRKFKGRVVFQGNNVRDENWEVAMFQELSSSPASMQAGRAVDMYGLLHGHHIEQADAVQAYTQSLLGGTKT